MWLWEWILLNSFSKFNGNIEKFLEFLWGAYEDF